MLAGCNSKLLSPRHRLRSEASAQFQACHFPSMSTQRLDLPCNFPRKDASRPQPTRSVGLSIENKPIESKNGGCSFKTENIKDEFWEKNKKSLKKKRFAGEVSYDEDNYMMNRVKKQKQEEGHLSLGQLGSENNFWFHPGPQVQPFSISCSSRDDEDTPPMLPPLSNIPWFDSVVTQITNLGDKINVDPIKVPEKEASGSSSSTSSESRRRQDLVFPKTGNGGSNPSEIVVRGQNRENNNETEHGSLELVSLLVSCAEQITSTNIPAINHCLARLGELVSPRGGSPLHRLIAYFTEALALRVSKLWPHVFHITTPRDFHLINDEGSFETSALRVLNQVSPIPKFIHFTSNEILLRAFEGKERVHIIDFDVKQGLQWPSFFQSLASRTNPPIRHVRITGIGESKQELVETGERLAGFARSLNIPFEFHPVVDRLEDVRLWMLHVKENECVAVNCVFQFHKTLHDQTGGVLREFLNLLRSTKAEVVVMAEQEASHNEATLDSRLCNALKYYSAVFDSVESTGLALESPARIKVEEMFGCEIRNIIGCEGRERFERHETFGKWEELMMEQGGFRNVGVSGEIVIQGQMLLRMYGSSCCESYRVEEKRGRNGNSVTLSWLDQPLYTVSAWTPSPIDDVAGPS